MGTMQMNMAPITGPIYDTGQGQAPAIHDTSPNTGMTMASQREGKEGKAGSYFRQGQQNRRERSGAQTRGDKTKDACSQAGGDSRGLIRSDTRRNT